MIRKPLISFLLTMLFFAAGSVWSENNISQSQPSNSGEVNNNLQGVGECQLCHSGRDLAGYTEPNGRIKSHQFIRLNESKTWEQEDPHSRAFAVLKGDLGKQMNQKLAKTRGNNFDILKAAECLVCHSSDQDRTKKFENKTVDSFVVGDVNGVNCTYCHTNANAESDKRASWVNDHWKLDNGIVSWRNIIPDNEKKKGLANLRNPVVKANLCVSCHVGNPTEGKVISHEMYAAGHPPLPPFELLTFMDDQPRHWNTPFELEYFKSLDSSKQSLFSFKAEEGKAGYAARHFAAGAIAALRAEVSLHAFDAKSLPATAGLDYARFDCYACHHDLKSDSDRQRRGFDGPPGRPPVKAWVGAVAGVVANHVSAERGAEFAKHWNELKIEMYSKPFGNPLTVGPKAQQLVDWCDRFAKEMENSKSFGVESAKTLHANLAIEARKIAADPEAVMALVWAYRGMSKALDRKDNLDELKPFLPLTLREKPFETGPSSKPVPKTVGQFTGERMKRFVNYQSAEFLKVFPR